MHRELELGKLLHRKLNFPIRDKPPTLLTPGLAVETQARRRAIRLETTALVTQGLIGQSVTEIAVGLGSSIAAVTGALVQFGLEPTSGDLVVAAKELLEDACIIVDKGLAVKEWEQVRVGTVMVEVVLRGLAAALALPYTTLVEYMYQCFLEAKTPDRETVQQLITAAREKAQAASAAGEPLTAANRQ